MSTTAEAGGPEPTTVRLATAGDIPVLVTLMGEFYAESGYPLDARWATSSFDALLANPAWGCSWLAALRGEPVGHVVLAVRYTMEHGGLGGHVDDLFVRPAFRRRGVARALLERLFADCRRRGCKSVQVEVGPGNAAARALYEAFGLVPHRDGRLLLCGEVPDG